MFAIEYEWTAQERAEEIEMFADDPDWLENHEGETPEEFVDQFPRSWVSEDANTLQGADDPDPRQGVRLFQTQGAAEAHIELMKSERFEGNEVYPGTFIVVEVR